MSRAVPWRALRDAGETGFLERSTDLLRVSRRSASQSGQASPHQSVVFLPLVLVLPLMAFAIVPGLLGRLIVLAGVGGATLRLLSATEEVTRHMSSREWTACFSV